MAWTRGRFKGREACRLELRRGIVVKVLPEPSLDLCDRHAFALVIVGDLIAVDFTKAEISRFRMSKIKPTHARPRPHRKRFGEYHSSVGPHVEQAPKRAFLSMVRARGIACSRPDSTILLMDQFLCTQAFFATVTPLIPNPLVQTFSKSFGKTIGEGFGHDGVVVVMLGTEAVAQLLQPDPAGYRECTDVVLQPGFPGRDKVGERPTWLAAFTVRLLAEEMKAFPAPLTVCNPCRVRHRRKLHLRGRSRRHRAR